MTKEQSLQQFIDNHLAKMTPMFKDAALANWQAANSGKAEDFEKSSEISLAIGKIYSDKNDFKFLKQMKESGKIQDQLLVRQLNKLYNNYLSNQMDTKLMKQIVELNTKIEKKFSNFRGTIDGQAVSDNEIMDIMTSATDSVKREQAWLTSKMVGTEVAADIVELVKLRNKVAHKLGFDNYHTMSLTLDEQDVGELDKIFDNLYKLTNKPFAKIKLELDMKLASNCGVKMTEVMPWHYHDPFFQQTPLVYDLDLDSYYADKDIKNLAQKFYTGIGLPVEDILKASDLYERPGKNQHAFCTDIDKEGDVRVLCNLRNNEQWMETILHELGHGVYDKYGDHSVPYLLRGPAHIFTTEAIAMMFGRLSRESSWIGDMMDLPDAEKAEIEDISRKYAQLKQLIFARWAMVMYNFEKQLYANPDQDLNTLWWDMVEKYQFVTRPVDRDEPDWAAKIHFAIAPCYYHNYALGELLASQLHNKITTDILGDGSYVGNKGIGEYLKKDVFEVGAIYEWNEMIERATGEKLNPKYFVEQFVY